MTRLLILIGLLSLAATAFADMYRWQDDEGRTHVSDYITPEAAKRGYDILNPQGRVIRHVDPPPTAEELAAREAADREAKIKAEEEKRIAKERERRDRKLRLSYTTVEEIEHTRDERLSLLASYIELNEKNLKQKEDELDSVRKRNQGFIDKQQEVPERFAMKQGRLEEEIATLEGNISQQNAQFKELKQRFDDDIARFKEMLAEKKAREAQMR